MMYEDFGRLEDLVADLPPSRDALSLIGKKIPGYYDRHIAKNMSGCPQILFTTPSGSRPPAMVLENIRVDHGLRCKIKDEKGVVTEGLFSIVQCSAHEPPIHRIFLRIMDSFVRLIPVGASVQEIVSTFNRVALLFLALKKPPQKSIRGLWAELFLISVSKEPVQILKSWHLDPVEVFDFSEGFDRIEVKGSGDRTRKHHFTYRQAYPPKELSVIVASIFVEPCTGGASLGELWDKAKSLAGSDIDLRLKTDQICLETLGSTWEVARNSVYDQHLAKQSLSFYDIPSIPKVAKEIPDGVTDVRFVSDLSILAPIDASAVENTLLHDCIGR